VAERCVERHVADGARGGAAAKQAGTDGGDSPLRPSGDRGRSLEC
jgi:hypothetical protein